MQIKFTKHFLNKLENLFSETDYILRYEKGRFQPGCCIINESKVAVINKYFSLEGKISSVLEILKTIHVDQSTLSEKNRKLYQEIIQTELQL